MTNLKTDRGTPIAIAVQGGAVGTAPTAKEALAQLKALGPPATGEKSGTAGQRAQIIRMAVADLGLPKSHLEPLPAKMAREFAIPMRERKLPAGAHTDQAYTAAVDALKSAAAAESKPGSSEAGSVQGTQDPDVYVPEKGTRSARHFQALAAFSETGQAPALRTASSSVGRTPVSAGPGAPPAMPGGLEASAVDDVDTAAAVDQLGDDLWRAVGSGPNEMAKVFSAAVEAGVPYEDAVKMLQEISNDAYPGKPRKASKLQKRTLAGHRRNVLGAQLHEHRHAFGAGMGIERVYPAAQAIVEALCEKAGVDQDTALNTLAKALDNGPKRRRNGGPKRPPASSTSLALDTWKVRVLTNNVPLPS